jgi:hypothetical protein
MNMLNLTTLPPIGLDDISGVMGLVRLASDPRATELRVQQLAELTETARKAVADAGEATAALEAERRKQRAALEQEKADAAREIYAARSSFEQERDAALARVAQQQSDLAGERERLAAARADVERLRANFENKLSILKSVSE